MDKMRADKRKYIINVRRNVIEMLLSDMNLLLRYVKILQEGRINYLLYGRNSVMEEYKKLEEIEQQFQLIQFKDE